MSKNIETYSIMQDMRDDLLQCYREVAPDCIYQHTAWRRTIMHPAKRYYVTVKQVYQRLNYYLNGQSDAIDGMRNKTRKQMYQDLLHEVLKVSQEPEHCKKGLKKLCGIAIMRPAPRFYISEETMRHIFSDVVHYNFDEDGRNISHRKQ